MRFLQFNEELYLSGIPFISAKNRHPVLIILSEKKGVILHSQVTINKTHFLSERGLSFFYYNFTSISGSRMFYITTYNHNVQIWLFCFENIQYTHF